MEVFLSFHTPKDQKAKMGTSENRISASKTSRKEMKNGEEMKLRHHAVQRHATADAGSVTQMNDENGSQTAASKRKQSVWVDE